MCKREASPPPLLPYKRRLVRGDAAQPALLPPQKDLRRSHSSPASLCGEPITLSLPSTSALLHLFPSPSPFFFFFFSEGVKIKRSHMHGEKKEPPVYLHLVNYKQGAREGCTLLLT